MKKISEFEQYAQQKLPDLLKKIQSYSPLRKRGPSLPWGMDVVVLGEKKMASLNNQYRRKSGPTDVLSFTPPPEVRQTGYLGEVVICLPVLKRQAKENGLRLEQELMVLLVHGVLHLLGFDHERTSEEAKKMEKWEKKLLSQTRPKVSTSLIQRGR